MRFISTMRQRNMPLSFLIQTGRSNPALRRRTVRCCSTAKREADRLEKELDGCENVVAATSLLVRCMEAARIPEPELSAEYLITHALGLTSRAEFRAAKGRLLQDSERTLLAAFSRRRIEQREPIQYIIGNWDFHNLTLLVRPPVLIPRPETEELVELILKSRQEAPPSSDAVLRLLDVGTGSGAILLALLNSLPKAIGVGIDINEESVKLSNENASHVGLTGARCEFLKADITEFTPAEAFDLVVSNPPYILEKDMAMLEPELTNHEDPGALCGGDDGLDVIRNILKRAKTLLKPNGELWLEVDPSHPQAIEQLCDSELYSAGLKYLQTYPDFNNYPRFCRLLRNNSTTPLV